jgi:TldD protein
MLKKSVMDDVLRTALSTGGDFAEIFGEDSAAGSIALIDGKVDQITSGRIHGVGIRIFHKNRSVYAYTNNLSRENLVDTAYKAAIALKDTPDEKLVSIALEEKINPNIHPILSVPSSVHVAKKIKLLREIHQEAKSFSPEIVQVVARMMDHDQRVMIANSDGLYTEDRRVRTRVVGQAIASNGTENQVGYKAPGRHMGFEMYSQIVDAASLGREVAETAVTMLHAPYAPAGQMQVVIDNEFGGVIFHEACGHSLEASSVAKGTSEFTGKLGEMIASPYVTAIDDATIPHGWGSQNIDDEGMPTQKNILIEKGILKGYLVDKLNGRRMNMEPTGSGRRESYQLAPTSRMSNTYIDNGCHTCEEIIKSVENGLYAKKLGGGSVDPATGEFNFAVLEGYILRDGTIQNPVRGASLIGKGSEILKRIDMVGNNLDFGTGMCGSESGSLPAFVGQPMIRVSSMTVGGK